MRRREGEGVGAEVGGEVVDELGEEMVGDE